MILFRKRIYKNTEEYCMFDTDVANRPKPTRGYIIKFYEEPDIPFLATHTPYKMIESLTFFPRYTLKDGCFLCENGWEEITEEEYKNNLLNNLIYEN